MGKRNRRGLDPGAEPRKRQKTVHELPTSEEIHTSRQLQQLLAFDQDLKKARHGLQSFKLFLDGLLDEGKDQDVRTENLSILKGYIESAKPRNEGDETSIYLKSVMETWSHAGQLNNDGILSAVPVVLHLLLKILSQKLETLPAALGIGEALLQRRQQELIARNLSADKGKEFIISPTLRMLREAMCLDGGALAKRMFKARSSMFKSLGRNMRLKYVGEGAEDAKRTSVRTNAVRFFLGALKFLHAEAKRELLSQKEAVTGLTKTMKEDPPYLILETLDVLRTYVLQDDNLPREAKGRFLNSTTLKGLGVLYVLGNGSAGENGQASVDDAVHSFLLTACTTPSCGVLRQDEGFYPRGTEQEEALMSGLDRRELTSEQIGWFDKSATEVSVRNVVLADFIQSLRPWSSVKQSELIIAIFEAAPELVAHYFANKQFTLEPKLSATWIGYAAFLFNVVALPVPDFFGRKSGYSTIPPLTSLVIDNILPIPSEQNQKALSRCLTSKSNLASFFAARILVLAMEKLDRVVELHVAAAQSNESLWMEASLRLVNEFSKRTASIQDVINSYRAIPEQDILHREVASRLLRLYYEILPELGLSAKFDVSPFLDKAVERIGAPQETGEPQDQVLRLLELENLLVIAMYSPGTRWFSKTENLDLSPFTAFLKACIDAPKGVSLSTLLNVLSFVAKEHHVISLQSERRRLHPLLESFRQLKESSPASVDRVWAFLDNCVSRCVAAPVKYIEAIATKFNDIEPTGEAESDDRVSQVAVAMLEQLPFFVQSAAGDSLLLKATAAFFTTFFTHSALIGEDRRLLQGMLAQAKSVLPEDNTEVDFIIMSANHGDGNPPPPDPQRMNGDTLPPNTSQKQAGSPDDGALTELLQVPDSLAQENSALIKWAAKSVDELVDEGYAVSLVSLLVSEHTSIRKEALTNILKMAAKVQQSEYDEKEQVWLLLSELAETARGHIDAEPLPSAIAAFACHALLVLKDPLHCLYAKVNTFLTRSPSWRLDQVPLVLEILQEDPEENDTLYAQLSWLAIYVADCLRTPSDVRLFHRKRLFGPLFERLFALESIPYMRAPLRLRLLSAVYRVTTINDGCTTLLTRFGVVSWLQAQRALYSTSDEERFVCDALVRRIVGTGDRDRLAPWARRGFLDYPGLAAGY